MRNNMITANRKAKTVIKVFDGVLKKEKLDKRDIGLIVEKITVFEDHLNVKLKSDVDELLSLEDTEHTVNFKSGSKDIAVTQRSANRADKVFTVNVIREGDPLEIYTDREGEVIFKKYSPIGELAVFAVQYAETLHKTCQLAIVICDRDAVVACAGVPKKDYGDRKISAEFEDLIEKRNFFASKDSSEKICITEGADTFVSCAMPIIAEGDIAGAVASVISDRDQRVCAEDIEEKLIQTAALFLGKQLES